MAEAREGARASKVPREVFTVTRRLAHEYIPYIMTRQVIGSSKKGEFLKCQH